FEVFMDTIVICTLTATAILTTGVLTSQAELTGAQLSLSAFSITLGGAGTMILSLGLSLFAFSTILGWYWYGETALVYLCGPGMIKPFKVAWIALVVLGGWGGAEILTNLWDLSDTLNGLMAIPNLVGLLLLTKELRRLTADFDAKLKSGELRK
ncbi:MAG: alanine:cation symporter family protein, partial [Synergistaceae bacterium]|nr:alanine:cation symporter family protein [Synergistaceae bacterium]